MTKRKHATAGETLKQLRVDRLLTQKELAQKIDVEPVTISRWERDAVPPSDINRAKLGRFFDVHPDEFRAFRTRAAA